MEKMAARRPVVWTHAFQDEDPLSGWAMEFRAIGGEHFDFITSSELKNSSEKAGLVEGALVHGAYGVYLDQVLPSLSNLTVVANCGVGINHLNVQALSKQGIKVSNTPNVLSYCVAEHTLALLLASARCIVKGNHVAKETVTSAFDTNIFESREVGGSTVGIVGLGHIGLELAKLLQTFHVKILYHNRNQRSEEVERSVGAVYYSSLDDMLPVCDYVVLLCALTPQTKHLMGENQFKLMKHTATLINVARGAVVDTDALVEALRTNQIRAAALDVTDPEPLPAGHDLRHLNNVIITPHCAPQTWATRVAAFKLSLKNLKAALIDGLPMPNEVKP